MLRGNALCGKRQVRLRLRGPIAHVAPGQKFNAPNICVARRLRVPGAGCIGTRLLAPGSVASIFRSHNNAVFRNGDGTATVGCHAVSRRVRRVSCAVRGGGGGGLGEAWVACGHDTRGDVGVSTRLRGALGLGKSWSRPSIFAASAAGCVPLRSDIDAATRTDRGSRQARRTHSRI
jgi:hypothetical protein